jgi:hypothetical protein
MSNHTFKVGDKVRIANRPDLTNAALIGEEGEIVEIIGSSMYVILPNHKMFSISKNHTFDFYIDENIVLRLELIGSQTSSQYKSRQERPCQVCQRFNDISIKICYWCGNPPF